jgi:polyisoprenoid-binding protein YceI
MNINFLQKIFSHVLLSIFFVSNTFAADNIYEADKNKSTITYQIAHPLHHIEATSKDFRCTIEIDATNNITKAIVNVDVSTFDSGNSSRDSHAMEVINSIDYPEVDFGSDTIITKGNDLYAKGKLTFHGITKKIEISAEKNQKDNALVLRGNFHLSLTDFKIERPALLMIPVEDTLRMSFETIFNLK